MRRRNVVRAFVAALLTGVFVLPAGASQASSNLAKGSAPPIPRTVSDRPGDFVINRPANLYERPNFESRVLRRLGKGTRVRVVEVSDEWYHIRSSHPGHPNGYVRRSYATAVSNATIGPRVFRAGLFRVTHPTAVHAGPSSQSRTITTLHRGTEVQVVGENGRWYRIESSTGRRPPGYIVALAARRVSDL
jgi:uncharacterized protein YgiM (DUF1202 family)